MNALDYLFGLEYHGIKLGLDNITALLEQAENPQNSYPTVHVGGTNGKGSTVAFLDHILRKAGYRVGRFTSPHLIDLNERFMINRVPITDSNLETLIETFRFQSERAGISPTFFEMNTAIAFQYFADEAVDIALIEVGLGGRYDSTNVIIPELSIVTNIDLEHTEFLGDTYESIAFEKGGIIKPGIPVLFGNLNLEAAAVLQDIARERNAPAGTLGKDFSFTLASDSKSLRFKGQGWKIPDILLPLAGMHQAENAAVALSAAELLSSKFPGITADNAKSGIMETRWPCRMETVLVSPRVIVDVAHNPAGAARLALGLDEEYILLLSVSSDKEIAGIVSALIPRAFRAIITQFDGDRSADSSDIAECFPVDFPLTIEPNFNEAIDIGIQIAGETDYPLVITGSLFTAGQARKYLIEKYDAPEMRF
jgi:dihydrofolate synthase/folylpolyglutamate synthase